MTHYKRQNVLWGDVANEKVVLTMKRFSKVIMSNFTKLICPKAQYCSCKPPQYCRAAQDWN